MWLPLKPKFCKNCHHMCSHLVNTIQYACVVPYKCSFSLPEMKWKLVLPILLLILQKMSATARLKTAEDGQSIDRLCSPNSKILPAPLQPTEKWESYGALFTHVAIVWFHTHSFLNFWYWTKYLFAVRPELLGQDQTVGARGQGRGVSLRREKFRAIQITSFAVLNEHTAVFFFDLEIFIAYTWYFMLRIFSITCLNEIHKYDDYPDAL